MVEREISIMKDLDHPNIVKIFQVYEDIQNIYIVMEYLYSLLFISYNKINKFLLDIVREVNT